MEEEEECWQGVIINNTPSILTFWAIPPTIAPPLTLPLRWCWARPTENMTRNYNHNHHKLPLHQRHSLEATSGFSILLQGTSKGGAFEEWIKELRITGATTLELDPANAQPFIDPAHTAPQPCIWTCKAALAPRNSLQMCLHKIPAVEVLDKKITKANVFSKVWSLYSLMKSNNFEARFNLFWQMLSLPLLLAIWTCVLLDQDRPDSQRSTRWGLHNRSCNSPQRK